MADSLLFDGDDRREFEPGRFAGTGAFSIATIVKRTGWTAAYAFVLRIDSVAPDALPLGIIDSGSGVFSTFDGSTERNWTPTVPIATADEWFLFGISKAAGTTTPRGHVYRYSTDTWEHGDYNGTIGNYPTPIGLVWAEASGESWVGNILIGGVWDSVLSDATFETLHVSKTAWTLAAPDEAKRFNTAGTIAPFIGTGTQVVSVGATLDTGDAPAGWIDDLYAISDNFDRSNETPVAAPWILQPGSTGNVDLVSNHLESNGTAGDKFVYYEGAVDQADQFSECVISEGSIDGGPAVRIGGNGSAVSGYFITFHALGKLVNGTFTHLGNLGTGFFLENGDRVRMQACDIGFGSSEIRVYVNDVEVPHGPWIDGDLDTGEVGAFLYESFGGTDYITEWKGGNLYNQIYTVAGNNDDAAGYYDHTAWPPSGGTFANDSVFDNIWIEANFSPGVDNYISDVICLRWDTTMSTERIIVQAEVAMYCEAKDNDDGASFNLAGGFYDYGGSPITSADWILNTDSGDIVIGPVSLTFLTVDADNWLEISEPEGVNKSGYTGIRLTMNGAITPTGFNYVEFADFEHATATPPRLLTYYYLEAQEEEDELTTSIMLVPPFIR